jgi:cystathionine gamma-lyase
MLPYTDCSRDLLILEHEHDDPYKYLGSPVPPVFMNSIHVFDKLEQFESSEKDGAFVYGRNGNPTVDVVERKIASLEHGKYSVAYSSGMAALTAAIMAACKAGDHIICMTEAYSSIRDTVNLFATRFGMSASYVTCSDLQELEDTMQENTALIVLESPASTFLRVVDLEGIANIAKKHGAKTYIDNSLCSPILQKPLDFGIDMVMHSLSKYIGGHSDVIGGIVTTNDKELHHMLLDIIRDQVGGCLGHMEAWLIIRSLRTLEMRVRESERAGIAAAKYLDSHPKVRKVYHTSLPTHPAQELIAKQQTGHPGLLGVTLDTDDEQTVLRFCNSLKVFRRGAAWGSFSSLVQMPLHHLPIDSLGDLLKDRLIVRLACGFEGADNLVADLEQALDQI